MYALSGVGLVVLYRASGVLNFAFGAIGAVGAHVAWSALQAEWPQGQYGAGDYEFGFDEGVEQRERAGTAF